MSGETNGAVRGGKRRRVWCETLPLDELATGPAFPLLAARAIHPIVAVRPSDDVDLVAGVVARAKELGLEPAIWPMLDDSAGRWCNATNIDAFASFSVALLDSLVTRRSRHHADAAPSELAVDLEPPIGSVRAAFVDGAANVWAPLASRAPLGPAVKRLGELIDRASELGVRCSAAFAPPVLLDSPGKGGWQRLLGTPVDGLGWASAGPMLYTSLFEGWSRGLVDRQTQPRALLARGCVAAARACFGAAASVSLGLRGPGRARDRAQSIGRWASSPMTWALARAAGIDDLALFDLGGVFRRIARGRAAGRRPGSTPSSRRRPP